VKTLPIALAVLFAICAILAILHPLAPGGMASLLGFAGQTMRAKHVILYLVLALVSLIWLRFQAGARS
jgi:hypothetical protein